MNPQDALELLCEMSPYNEQTEAACDSLYALLRRDWAVRVLDAWGREHHLAPPIMERLFDGQGFYVEVLHRYALPAARYIGSLGKFRGDTEDAVRHAAALAVFQRLAEAVRQELGECP